MKQSMMKSEMGGMCCTGMCARCHGWKWFIVGVIFLVNAYWPFFSNWWVLVGWLLVVLGILKILMPSCPHCK